MNKLHVSALSASVGGIILASTASAALFYEPFPYLNGNLAGNINATAPATENGFTNTNVWTVNSATPDAVKVVDGDLTYTGLPTTPTTHMAQLSAANKNPVRIGIGEYPEGSTIYYSMLVQVPLVVTNFGSSTTTGSFFAGFQFNPSPISSSAAMNATTSGAGGALTIHKAADGLGYNLGIAFRDIPAATSRVFDNTHEFAAGETVFVVGKYEIKPGSQNDVATLYLNPDPNGPEPAMANAVSDASVLLVGSTTNYDYMYDNASGGQLETAIRSFFLRSNGVEPTNINIDEVRIGTSWGQVTGQVIIPEPATISLLGIAAVGLFALRHRWA
jgi:hypothetical protein